MKLDKATIQIEVNDTKIEFDVLDMQLKIEELQKAHGEDERAIIAGIAALFKEHDVELTTTQAWSFVSIVHTAFENHKKKLGSTCESAFGTIPTHLQGPG